MFDQRGGAFTLGLGLVEGLSIVPEAESWSEERRKRTLSLADTPFVELPTGSALVHGPDGWELVGDADRPRRAALTSPDGRLSAGRRLGDLDPFEDDLLGRCVALGRRQGEHRFGDVEALGDLAEHDVGALGVEGRRRIGDGEEPLRRRPSSAAPVRAMAS